MKTFRSAVCLSVVAVFIFVTNASSASAQGNCLPFSGTIYGALYAEFGQSPAWHLVGGFRIGHEVYDATIDVTLTSLSTDEDIWQGAETWTFDFGEDDTIQLMTDFVTEHMTNPDGIFHIREVGTFANGTGAFKHADGNLSAEGPFGPNVVLHNVTQLPADALMFWVAPSQGMICGSNNRNKKAE